MSQLYSGSKSRPERAIQQAASIRSSSGLFVQFTLRPWGWKLHFSPKRLAVSGLHGITIHKTYSSWSPLSGSQIQQTNNQSLVVWCVLNVCEEESSWNSHTDSYVIIRTSLDYISTYAATWNPSTGDLAEDTGTFLPYGRLLKEWHNLKDVSHRKNVELVL